MPAALVSGPLAKRTPKRVLPGFNITLGFTLFYLSVIVLIPLSALCFKTFTLTWEHFVSAVSSPRVVASYQLTFGASFLAALVNAVFGLLLAWVLVRYEFPGKKTDRRFGGLAFCPAHGGGWYIAHRLACQQRLDRQPAGALWH